MRVIGCYNKTIWLTFLGMAFSVIGMAHTGDTRTAMVCLLAAGICDLFDGLIARKAERTELEKQYGIQLDSLVDAVSFLVFPVIFLIRSIRGVHGIAIALIYVFCGITRLAWFNVTTYENNRVFHGVPVTYIALVLPVFHLSSLTRFGELVYYDIALCLIFLVMSLLFVLDITVKKPSGLWYLVFSVLAVTTAAIYLLTGGSSW